MKFINELKWFRAYSSSPARFSTYCSHLVPLSASQASFTATWPMRAHFTMNLSFRNRWSGTPSRIHSALALAKLPNGYQIHLKSWRWFSRKVSKNSRYVRKLQGGRNREIRERFGPKLHSVDPKFWYNRVKNYHYVGPIPYRQMFIHKFRQERYVSWSDVEWDVDAQVVEKK